VQHRQGEVPPICIGGELLGEGHSSRDTVRHANWSQPVLEKVASGVVSDAGDAWRGQMSSHRAAFKAQVVRLLIETCG
jgi:hypothetical protein